MSMPTYLENLFEKQKTDPRKLQTLLDVAESVGLASRTLRKNPKAPLPKIVNDLVKWSFSARHRGRRDPESCSASRSDVAREAGIRILSARDDEMDKTYIEIMRNLRFEGDDVRYEPLSYRISKLAFRKLLPILNEQDQRLQRMFRQLEYRKRAKKKEYNQRLFPPVLRALIMERDGFACVLCGINADECKGRRTSLTIDHIVPWCEGGKTSYENGRVLCGICNSDKEVARRSLGMERFG
jgi:5-methylcytosine-specific restriction endonuclease McrA